MVAVNLSGYLVDTFSWEINIHGYAYMYKHAHVCVHVEDSDENAYSLVILPRKCHLCEHHEGNLGCLLLLGWYRGYTL